MSTLCAVYPFLLFVRSFRPFQRFAFLFIRSFIHSISFLVISSFFFRPRVLGVPCRNCGVSLCIKLMLTHLGCWWVMWYGVVWGPNGSQVRLGSGDRPLSFFLFDSLYEPPPLLHCAKLILLSLWNVCSAGFSIFCPRVAHSFLPFSVSSLIFIVPSSDRYSL